jgi:uncharacterized membrane protein YfcA
VKPLLDAVPEPVSLAFVLVGALVAGFTTGFAGFGTGLVAAGFWFHALPAAMVPPLAALTSVIAQLVGLATVRRAFEWRRAAPFLIGGALGVPIGVVALSLASPAVLRLSVGVFLASYAGLQLFGFTRHNIGEWGGGTADGTVGIAGGFLGGFAGLSGPLPLVWLQMRGGSSARQRATYQPFNLIVLALASFGMAFAGTLDKQVLTVAALCLPVTLAGAWLGAQAYGRVSDATFRQVILVLLLGSGALLVAQGLV